MENKKKEVDHFKELGKIFENSKNSDEAQEKFLNYVSSIPDGDKIGLSFAATMSMQADIESNTVEHSSEFFDSAFSEEAISPEVMLSIMKGRSVSTIVSSTTKGFAFDPSTLATEIVVSALWNKVKELTERITKLENENGKSI